ncbi:flagellar protein [Paenibacillus qinlingensis]|uniref:flagellar protein n=1 Tax=Paenibacillus qinlingensis TaxID=1837343 RepID=UPI0015678B33|nr:flagellar protein [Paenibacillus qinlingensis]NQX58939.1 flagellar protein [Paenibacillus qinlingensis]
MAVPQQLMVANCPRCGKVFQRNLRNQCMDCSTSINDQLKDCVDYLRRNYRSSNEQVCAATGVSNIQLQVWMKEGKLHLADYPNLSYQCASCAEPIRVHKLCVSCSTRITRDIRKLSESGTVQQRMNQPESKPQGNSAGFKISDRWNRV